MLTLQGHENEVRGLAFTPDGQRLASVSDDCTARIWNVATATEEFELRDHTAPIICLAMSPDGKRLATGGHDRRVTRWNLEDGSRVTFGEYSAPITQLAYSPDGRYFAVGLERTTQRSKLVLEQLSSNDVPGTRLSPFSTMVAVWGLAFSPDSKLIALGLVLLCGIFR